MIKGVNFKFSATNAAGPAMKGFQNGLAAVKKQTDSVNASNQSWMKGMSQNRRAFQQIGFQVTDFSVQIAGGQSAMLAFIQQGGQILQFFGTWGAVMAGVLSVFGTMAYIFMKTGGALNDLTPIFGVFESDLTTLVSIMKSAISVVVDGINLVVNNLDVMLTAALFFFGKWAYGFVMGSKLVRVFTLALAMSRTATLAQASVTSILSAHVFVASTSMATYRAAVLTAATASVTFVRSIFTINGALTILRAVTLIDLIAVLARFTGTAIVSFGTVAARAVMMAVAVGTTAVTSLMSLFSTSVVAAGGLGALSVASMLTAARMVLLNGAALVVKAAFLTLNVITTAAALAQVAFSVAAGIAQAALVTLAFAFRALSAAIIATGIGAIIIAAAYLVTKLFELREATGSWAEVLTLLGDVAKGVWTGIWESAAAIPPALASVWNSIASDFYAMVSDLINAWAGMLTSMGNAISNFSPSMAESLYSAGSSAMKSSADWAESANNSFSAASKNMADAGAIVTKAWTPAKDAMSKITELLSGGNDVDVRDWMGGATAADKAKGGGGGGKSPASDAQKEADRIKKIFEDMQSSISSSMLGSFKALLKGTKSIGEAAMDILNSIIDKVIDLLMTPIFNNIAGGLASGIMGGLGRMGASFDGGGSTGAGPRAGGMDGKGGRLAMLHPRETVVDHTKGQTMGGTTVHMTVNTPDAESFRRSSRQIALQMRTAMDAGSR